MANDSIKEGALVEFRQGSAHYYPGGPAIPSWVITDYYHRITQVLSGGKPVVKGGKECVLLGKKVNRKTGAEDTGIDTWADKDILSAVNDSHNGGGSHAVGTYTVKKGDTLWGIAEALLGSGSRYPEIKQLNGLTSDTIQIGQVLKVPTGSDEHSGDGSYEVYTIKNGDTLWGIAEAKLGSGSRYPEIKTLNGLTSDTIIAGKTLKIPKK